MLQVSCHTWQNPAWICQTPNVYQSEDYILICLRIGEMGIYVRADQADQIADAMRKAAVEARDMAVQVKGGAA